MSEDAVPGASCRIRPVFVLNILRFQRKFFDFNGLENRCIGKVRDAAAVAPAPGDDCGREGVCLAAGCRRREARAQQEHEPGEERANNGTRLRAAQPQQHVECLGDLRSVWARAQGPDRLRERMRRDSCVARRRADSFCSITGTSRPRRRRTRRRIERGSRPSRKTQLRRASCLRRLRARPCHRPPLRFLQAPCPTRGGASPRGASPGGASRLPARCSVHAAPLAIDIALQHPESGDCRSICTPLSSRLKGRSGKSQTGTSARTWSGSVLLSLACPPRFWLRVINRRVSAVPGRHPETIPPPPPTTRCM